MFSNRQSGDGKFLSPTCFLNLRYTRLTFARWMKSAFSHRQMRRLTALNSVSAQWVTLTTPWISLWCHTKGSHAAHTKAQV